MSLTSSILTLLIVISVCERCSSLSLKQISGNKFLCNRLSNACDGFRSLSRTGVHGPGPLRAASTLGSILANANKNPSHCSKPLSQKFLASATMLMGFVNPSVTGGLLSGGLHAISGPDHLAALLPPSVGKPGWYGMKLGAVWGLGHGVSAILLGLCAFFLKGRISVRFGVLEKLSTFTEAAVGASLFGIGALGIKENIEARKSLGVAETEADEEAEELIHIGMYSFKSSRAIFANGLLHGFSWDGAPSLAPALAMTSWRSVLSFLVSYCVGTMIAMSVAAGAFGEGSMRIGKAADNPKLPMNLSFASSLIAIIIGVYWIVQAIWLK